MLQCRLIIKVHVRIIIVRLQNRRQPNNENQSQGRTEIEPIKCWVQNNEISTCLLTRDEYAMTP